jgi:SAM-dependent methyltransferase
LQTLKNGRELLRSNFQAETAQMQGQSKSERVCRLCGQEGEASPIGLVSNSYPLMSCQTCEGVLVESKPSDEELRQLYDQAFSDGMYEANRREFEALRKGAVPRSHYREKLLQKTQRFTSGKSIVEIGGGTGAFSAAARAQGYDYTDYDVSEVAVRCQTELGNKAHWFHPSELPPIPPQSADIIVMWEVIEHVWTFDAYLQKIRTALKPGGVYLFSTPNFKCLRYQLSLRRGGGSAPPIHINFFTPESLTSMLRRRGFARVEFVFNRLYRPPLKLKFMWDSFCTALGIRAANTIFGLAQ